MNSIDRAWIYPPELNELTRRTNQTKKRSWRVCELYIVVDGSVCTRMMPTF